MLSHDISLKH